MTRLTHAQLAALFELDKDRRPDSRTRRIKLFLLWRARRLGSLSAAQVLQRVRHDRSLLFSVLALLSYEDIPTVRDAADWLIEPPELREHYDPDAIHLHDDLLRWCAQAAQHAVEQCRSPQ